MAYRFDSFYIGGAWAKPSTTDVLTLENPATRAPFATVPDATPADAVAAIEAAASALPAWSATPLAKRVELMQKALEVFKTYRDEIIRLEALELGAPVSYSANAHCDYQFTRIESYIRESQKVVLEEQFEQSTVVHEPIGVIACITPWNYPLGQVVQKIIPALLMGNTVVLKPSQHTPLTAYLLVDSLDRAGFPAGTVNLITGRGSKLGDTLASHPLVDMISFTGSTAVGIKLSQKALEGVKRISLELGGKSPFIWLPSEDYEPAINQLFGSVFYNSGQTCTALTRLLVPESDLEKSKRCCCVAFRNSSWAIRWIPRQTSDRWLPKRNTTRCSRTLNSANRRAPNCSAAVELLKPAKATSSSRRSLSTSPIPCALLVKKSSVPYFA